MQTERLPDQVPFEQLMTQPVMFNHNMPPVMFRLNVSQRVAPFIPALTAEIANISGNTAANNIVRVYVYNSISQNGWQNNLFADMVTAAAMYLEWLYFRNNVMDFSGYINQAATKAIEFFGSKIALSSGRLLNQLDPGTQEGLRRNAMAIDSIITDVSNMLTTQQAQTYMGMPMGYQPPMGMQQPMGMMVPSVPMQAPSVVHLPMPMGQFGSPTGRMTVELTRPITDHMVVDRYARDDREEFQPIAVPEQVHIPQRPTPVEFVVEEKPTTIDTKGNHDMIDMGDVQVMDRKAHTITYRGVPFGGNYENREQAVRNAMENTDKDMTAVGEGPIVKYQANPIGTDSIYNLFFEMESKLSQYAKDGNGVEVLACNALIYRPVLSQTNLRSQIKSLIDKAKTVEDLAKLIGEVLKRQCSKANKHDFRTIRVYRILDDQLTKAFNNFMCLRMDTSIKVTSFADDCIGMTDYLESKGHTTLVPLLSKFLAELKALYAFDMEELEKNINDMIVGDSGEVATLIFEAVGAISLGLLYDELFYNMHPGDVYKLPHPGDIQHPIMASVHELIQKLSVNSQIPVYRYYIKTIDDRMLIASSSLVSEGDITIRLIP